MEKKYYYATVSEAIDQLRGKGFNIDFNLEENCVACHAGKFKADEFEVAEIYRYEGNSDPADEATVYGIESKSGLKGILVMGDEISMDDQTADILKKLNPKDH